MGLVWLGGARGCGGGKISKSYHERCVVIQ